MSEFDTAFDITPFQGIGRRGDFFVPPSIRTDYSAFLSTDIPNVTHTVKLVRDWSLKDDTTNKPPFIRCILYPINWKSNFAAADEGVNFRTDFREVIKKGDMIEKEDGDVYLVAWAVHGQINNQPSQAKRCNHIVNIIRRIDDKLDKDGYLIEKAHDKVIVGDTPCCIYQYDGRPEYKPIQGQPGIVPEALCIFDIQMNAQTKNLREDDTFLWGYDRWRVININHAGVNIIKQTGLLQVSARRVAGDLGGRD